MAYHSQFNKEQNIKFACGLPLLPFRTKIDGPGMSQQYQQKSMDIIDEAFTYFRINVLFKNYQIKGPGDKILVYLFVLLSHCFKTLEQVKDQPTARKRLGQVLSLPVPGPKEKSNFIASFLQEGPPNQKDIYNQYIKHLRAQAANRIIAKYFRFNLYFFQKGLSMRTSNFGSVSARKSLWDLILQACFELLAYNDLQLMAKSLSHFIQIQLLNSSNLLQFGMKNFTNTQKENMDTFSSTQGRFYPRVRRQSQMGRINEMVFSQKLLQNLKSIRQLNHFKKNNNKIECNIQQDRKQPNKSIKLMRKKTVDCSKTAVALRRSQNDLKFEKQKQFKTNSSMVVQTHAKPSLPSSYIKKFNVYPRYKTLELYSLYRSILQYSQRDPKKFLQAFQSALNYQKIMIKSEIVKKNLYDQKKMDFKDFIVVYKKMEDLMFIQSIIDYLEIIFQVHSKHKMRYELVYQILVKRSQPADAITITDIIFKNLAMNKQGTVQLQDILELCQRDIEFCATFSRLYHKQSL